MFACSVGSLVYPDSLPTGSTNFDHDGLSGRFMTVRAMPYGPQKFSSCHDFSVKLSLCIHVATLTVAALAVGIRM